MGKTSVAVIGAGPLGLMALKGFKEDGFEATVFESRDWVGGLWKHSTDDSLSVGENTVFNSSKYRTAISDFPMPDDFDDFPTAKQLHRYFESYCDHFDLWPHIKLNSPVKIVKHNQHDWIVQVGTPDGSGSVVKHFDKVVFACGTFTIPRKPDFEGIEKFEGTAIHSLKFNNPAQYKGKNVLIVGFHASAQDTATALEKHAKKMYLSHKSGIVLVCFHPFISFYLL